MNNRNTQRNRRANTSRLNRRRRLHVEMLEDRRLLAAMTDGPETLVNDFTTSTQTTRAETQAVAGNATGEFAVAFDGRGPDGFQEIYLRRFDSTSTPIGSQILVNVTTNSNQRYASVAMGAGGETAVAWSGPGAGDNDGGVFVRLFDNTGVAVSGEIKVSETVPSDQHKPVIAKASDGSFIVTWSGKGIGDSSGGVLARRFTANGVPLSGEFLVNTTTAIAQQEPDIAIASDGSFVITWSGKGPGDGSGIFFQRYDASGSPVGPETRVNTTITGAQKLPSVGIDGANNFMIVWSGFGNTAGNADSRGVFLQRYNAAGTPVGGETLVNTTTLFDQEDASIAVPPSGRAVVTWTSNDGSQRGVFAQEFDGTGAKDGGEIQVNTSTTNDQKFSSVAMRGENFTVAWYGNGNGDNRGVFIQSYSRNQPPEIVSDGGGDTASVNIDEHTTAVTDVDATDPEGETENGGGLSYSLTTTAGGGADNSFFTLNTSTGLLSFTSAPDFENPLDGGANPNDNDYEVQVTVTDSGGLTDFQDITVTVDDVASPSVTIDSPAAGSSVVNFVLVQLTGTDPSGNNQLIYDFSYSTDGGTTFLSATDFGGGTLFGNPTFIPQGAGAQSWEWDSSADIRTDEFGTIFQVGVTDNSTGESGSAQIIWDVPNQATCTIDSPAGGSTIGADQLMSFTTVQPSPNGLDLLFEYSTDGGTTFVMSTDAGGGTVIGNPVFGVAPGADTWEWDTATDVPGSATGVIFRTTISDAVFGPPGNSTCSVTLDVDQSPEITSDGGGDTAAISIDENTTAVTDVDSSDPQGETENGGGLTYSLTTDSGGGADNGFFTLNAGTGVLTFTAAPDFENPLDVGTNPNDNDYEVQVTVTDSGGLTDIQDITVTVLDVDPESTATNDSYTGIIANVGLDVLAVNGLLANDLGGPVAVTAVNGVGANVGNSTPTANGDVTVQSDGSFLYEPGAANFAADSFTYELDNATTATVDLSFGTDLIWFIDVNDTGADVGTLSDPFQTIAGYNGVAAAGDEVFIADGSATGPLNLPASANVVGEGATGVTATLLGVTEPTDSRALPSVGGTAPVITTAGAGVDGITLGTNNTIRGIDIGNTGGTGISGILPVTLFIREVGIFGTGGGVEIFGTGADAIDVVLDSLSASSSTEYGILLQDVSGDFDVTATNGTITNTGRPAVGILTNPSTLDLGLTFASVSSTGSDDVGISLVGTTGTFDVNGGSISGSTAHAFGVSSGSTNVTYDGTISQTNANSAVIAANNTGGTIDFNGAITANTSTANGINLTTNTGTTFTFDGGLDIDTTSGVGFNATGGGTVSVTGTNDIDTLGTALSVADTDIGAGGLTFRSISAAGSANGIFLSNTGTTAGLTVTGDGSTATQGGNDTGGVITTTGSADGIVLTNTQDITLQNMTIGDTAATPADGADGTNNIGDDGIHASSVNGLTLNYVTIARTATHGVRGINVTDFTLDNSLILNAGDDQEENGLDFTELRGDNFVTNSLFDAFNETGIEVTNASGTVDLTITDTTFQDNQATVGNAGEEAILLIASGSAEIIAKVNGTGATPGTNTAIFNDIESQAIQAISEGTSSIIHLTVDNIRSLEHQSGDGIIIMNPDNGGSGNLTVRNSFFTDNTFGPFAILAKNDSTGTLDLTVQGNTTDDLQLLSINHDDIGSGGAANGTTRALIGGTGAGQGNNVTLTTNNIAVDVISTDSGGPGVDLHLTIQNNTTSQPDGNFTFTSGLRVDAQNTSEVNINISDNSFQGDVGAGIELRELDTGAINLQGFAGGTVAAAQTFVDTANPGSTAGSFITSVDANIGGGAATLPTATTQPSPLHAASTGAGGSSVSAADLAATVDAAIARFAAAGVSSAELALLESTEVSLRALPSSYLGVTNSQGQVTIDTDGAGWGWFIDTTPYDDEEFGSDGVADAASAADGQMDLLTVVIHELAHVLGHDHDELLSETLADSTRADLDAFFANLN